MALQALPWSSLPVPFSALLRQVDAKTSPEGGWDVLVDERKLRVGWLPGSKNQPNGFELQALAGPREFPPRENDSGFEATSAYRGGPWATARNPGPLALRWENRRDRFGKRLGLNREIQLGDAEFDARVYVECDAPDATVRLLLSNEHTRRGIVRLLEMGAPALQLDRDGRLIVRLHWRDQDVPSGQQFGLILETLGAIAESLPALRGRAPQLRGSYLVLALVLLSLALLVLGVPIIFLCQWLWPVVDGGPYWQCIAFGLAAYVLSLPLVFWLCRGRSTALRDFGMYASFSLFSSPMLAVSLGLTVNGAFDTSTPKEHPLLVVHRWESRGKSTSYHVQLASPAPSQESYALSVSSTTYWSLPPGSRAVVTTRDGALGWEWLIDVRPIR